MRFLRKAFASLFGQRDPSFGPIRFNEHGYWKGEYVLEGQAVTLTVFADLEGPTDKQRASFELIRGRSGELLAVALAKLQGLKKLGYASVEELRGGAFVQQIAFQPESSPSDWGFEITVNDRKNVDRAWIANVQFVGDTATLVNARRD